MGVPVGSKLDAGLDVAEPIRDDGVDLIVYRRKGDGAFYARPIQLKTSTTARFAIDRKYERREGLIMAYVWGRERSTIYALAYDPDVNDIARKMGWEDTDSWRTGGHNKKPGWSCYPNPKLLKLLSPFEATPDRWRTLQESRS